MAENQENGTQKTPEETIKDLEATIAELKPKADASSQNFERLKKLEADKKELEEKLKAKEGSATFDPAKLKSEVEEKVNLRLAGLEPEVIEEIEKFARGSGMSLTEASKHPFVTKAVEGIRAEKKNTETTPTPSSKGRLFNGKSVDDIFKSGTEAEKQAAWESMAKKGVKSSE